MTAARETLRASEVEVGTQLPELRIEATPTFVISTALATRDFQDVHHDRDLAAQRGSRDIFLNILTDTGLVQRFVTDWAGPEALVRSVNIKLGVPCYAYDALTFTGTVTGREQGNDEQRFVIDVSGRASLGEHVRGSVHIVFPQEDP